MYLKKIVFVMIALWLASFAAVYAAPQNIGDKEDQREAAKRAAEDIERRSSEELARIGKERANLGQTALPKEENSFRIKEIRLEGEHLDEFPWIEDYLNKYKNMKIGIEGINILLKQMNESLLDKGYVTSKVYIKEQDLSTGTLTFTLSSGLVRDIKFAGEKTWGLWQNAFPIHRGNVLNIRKLEQGLEQMRRVPSQDVDIDIQPADTPGQSDVILTVKRTKPWRLSMSIDDSGVKDTGKNQISGTLSIDNLFSANDIFYTSYNKDSAQDNEVKGTRADSFYYSIPLGDLTFSFSRSHNEYHQTVKTAILPMKYSGKSDYYNFNATQMLYRDQKGKTDLEFGIIRKARKTFINDSEIAVQRQNTTALRVGILQKQYIGKSVLDMAFRFQKGVNSLGAKPGPTDHLPNKPTTMYDMYLFDLNLNTPFQLCHGASGRYNLTIRGQYTEDYLYGSDFFSIGGRYTVRGFDGEQVLSAERGLFIRQEISFPIIKKQHQIYAALDYGKLSGPSTQYILGQEIAGCAIGLRGKIKALQYDVFAGWALKKPAGFETAKQTFGFQATVEI